MTHYRRVCTISDLTEGQGYEVVLKGRPVALFLNKGKVYAVDDRCCHREGQLSKGWVKDNEVICPLHQWNFDLETGISPYNPKDRINTYPVMRLRDEVLIDVDTIEPIPPATFSGYQGRWRRFEDDSRGKAEVRKIAKGLKPSIEAMGSTKRPEGVLSFDHFNLKAAQLAKMPLLDDEPVDVSMVIGGGCSTPLSIALPAYVSHMSFGALSKEAKLALAKGSAEANTLICSGEGGMLPEERSAASTYILEMASGYFGWNDEAISKADAIEIKLGQSAKPGLGGELPADKVTGDIAAVRGLDEGRSAHSPSRFPDISSVDQMAQRIDEIRQKIPGKPIGIKFAANDVENDLRAALTLNPDFITIDGFGGGTGAAPIHVRDHFGMSIIAAIPIARQIINESGQDITLVATGGIRTPADVIKAIALGADCCALATASLFALGCEYYRACDSGHCPTGIATQNGELSGRIDIDTGAKRVANFFSGTQAILEQYLRVMGYRSISEISKKDLIPLSIEAKAILD